MRSSIAFLFVALSIANAGAAELAQIRERGVLRVGIKNEGAAAVSGHRDPAHFQKRDFEMELARSLAAHLFGDPAAVAFSTRRKADRLPAVASGEVDLGLAMHRIVAGDAPVVYSSPYFETGLAVLQRPDGRIAEAGDLAGKSIALVRRHQDELTVWLHTATAGMDPAPRVVDVANFAEAADAIDNGRVDALLSEAVNIDAFLSRHATTLERSPLLTRERIGVAVARADHQLLQFVNAVLAELTRTGELAAMRGRANLGQP